jgi:hypothetical protein
MVEKLTRTSGNATAFPVVEKTNLNNVALSDSMSSVMLTSG